MSEKEKSSELEKAMEILKDKIKELSDKDIIDVVEHRWSEKRSNEKKHIPRSSRFLP